MKLANYFLSNPINWDNTNVNTLVIENSENYYNVVSMLLRQIQGEKGDFVLSDDVESLVFSKHVEFITDLFNINVNEKKILNGIYKELSENCQHDASNHFFDLFSTVNSAMLDFILEFDYDLTFDEICDITPLLKATGVRIDSNEFSLGEKLILYMELCEKFLNRKLFIFLNLKACMSLDAQRSFFKDVQYRSFNLLLIESHSKSFTTYEKALIIDEDLCEI